MGITCSNSRLAAFDAAIYGCACVCVRLCVFVRASMHVRVLAEAVATSLMALWVQQWRLFLNASPAPCPRQAATGTAAHLSCQHSLCLPEIYLAELFGCVHFCVC